MTLAGSPVTGEWVLCEICSGVMETVDAGPPHLWNRAEPQCFRVFQAIPQDPPRLRIHRPSPNSGDWHADANLRET